MQKSNKTTKLVLIQPPIQDFYETSIRLQPIGLCYLKATVYKFLPEWEVVVKDYHHGWGRHTIPLPKELVYLKEYYAYPDKSPFSSFYHYYHFGASFLEIGEQVASESPDLVGISSLFSPYYREVLACADAIKSHINVPIIAGGSHVSADPIRMLQYPSIDYVIRGEGERPLICFLEAWKQQEGYGHVPNLGWKRNGTVVLNPIEPNYAIDEIPFPDFSDFSVNQYLFEKRPLCFLITSRGCPYHCSFCSVHQTFGQRYRKRSVVSIFQEILQRVEEGYRIFDFEDDDLTFHKEEMKRLCEKIIAHFSVGQLQLLAMNGISYLHLDQELLRLMKEAGFSHLNLALVSADSETRSLLNRPFSLEKYLGIVQQGVSLKFNMVAYQILGLPQEKLETMMTTLVLNTKLPVLLGASMFYLTPNSPIAQDFPACSEEDIFKSRLTAMAIETSHFSRNDIFTLFITTRIINFLKGIVLPEDSMPLHHVLSYAASQGGKTATGVALLCKLFEEKKLYAVVGQDLQPIKQFRFELFFQIWSQIDYIGTQAAQRITDLENLLPA